MSGIRAAVDSSSEIDYARAVASQNSLPLWSALLAVNVVAACAGSAPAPTHVDLAQAKSRAVLGTSVYDRACANCHGPNAEGLAGAPPLVGATALPRYPRDQSTLQLYQNPQEMQHQAQLRVPGTASRQKFIAASDIDAYLRQHMAEQKTPTSESLRDEDYWAVITFVLIANGSAVPEGGISATNASSVLIRAE
jgi:mono/diheme cytochrome c family protein